jgi:hypothetical protein
MKRKIYTLFHHRVRSCSGLYLFHRVRGVASIDRDMFMKAIVCHLTQFEVQCNAMQCTSMKFDAIQYSVGSALLPKWIRCIFNTLLGAHCCCPKVWSKWIRVEPRRNSFGWFVLGWFWMCAAWFLDIVALLSFIVSVALHRLLETFFKKMRTTKNIPSNELHWINIEFQRNSKQKKSNWMQFNAIPKSVPRRGSSRRFNAIQFNSWGSGVIVCERLFEIPFQFIRIMDF